MKWTQGKPGRHSLDPYNMQPFIPDLKNSLGHFDVIVEQKAGSINIYRIEKESYHFGFRENDKDKRGQHGFEVPLNAGEIEKLKPFLPTRTYVNPGGFPEKFEFKKIHGKWTLYVPYDVASKAGKPFKVYGVFER